jgi:hypothetical protein
MKIDLYRRGKDRGESARIPEGFAVQRQPMQDEQLILPLLRKRGRNRAAEAAQRTSLIVFPFIAIIISFCTVDRCGDLFRN